MFCCKIDPSVPDLANDLKQLALREMKRKGILGNAYFLLRCANPYGFDGIVVTEERGKIKIHYCGDLVFHWEYGLLKKYICGDWTSMLSNEAKTTKAYRIRVQAKDRKQLLMNKIATQNYVVC